MVMGRSSPSGSGELWALCDCEEVAADVHNKLNKIIEEECEKKKKLPNGSASLWFSSFISLLFVLELNFRTFIVVVNIKPSLVVISH